MKKVERINTIMRYINNRSRFTISEIMREFDISRSTAIRDIKEIESMGMPLVAEVGRDGGYFVMNNSVLPAARFTDNEIKALFIAFMATRNQQLPYLQSRQSLAEKLLGLISQNQQDDLVLLNQLLLFEGTNPHHPDLLDLSDLPHPMLEQIIHMLLSDRCLTVAVQEGQQVKTYTLYLLHLHRENSLWLMEGFDLMEEQRRIIPVDHVVEAEPFQPKKRVSAKRMMEALNEQAQKTNLTLELGPKAIAQFRKYHPLKASLAYTNPFQTTALLKMYVQVDHPEEVTEIANWLLFLGEDIKFKEVPEEVLSKVKNRLGSFCP